MNKIITTPAAFGIYVAGPMRGYPNHNRAAFIQAMLDLEYGGWEKIWSPLECSAVGKARGWNAWQFLRYDLGLVLKSEAVAVLPGWEVSAGATREVALAQSLNIPLFPLHVAVHSGPTICLAGNTY